MSYNPCRGSGICLDRAQKSADRYRNLYVLEDMVHFDALYRKSKYLYYWYINWKKTMGSTCIEEMISRHDLEKFREFRDRLFPKLQPLIK